MDEQLNYELMLNKIKTDYSDEIKRMRMLMSQPTTPSVQTLIEICIDNLSVIKERQRLLELMGDDNQSQCKLLLG